MRIGIFGGTFDPVHYGHLIVAEQAREQAELDQVWFVPSARPPHKPDHRISPFDRRAEMVSLAVAGQEDRFRVEPIEKDRPGPSYTADTLDELAARHPAGDWFLILGADSVRDLPTWYEPLRIIDRATILVAGRPGSPMWTAADLAAHLGIDAGRVNLRVIDSPQIDIASRDLRQRAAEGRSLLFQVPHSVRVYIREKQLYRSDPGEPRREVFGAERVDAGPPRRAPLRKASASRLTRIHFRSNTTFPPTTVIITLVSVILSRSAGSRMSRDRTTKSASLPALIDPRSFSWNAP
jgi:nicotinate-nucleotide adenylyltransferase